MIDSLDKYRNYSENKMLSFILFLLKDIQQAERFYIEKRNELIN